MWMVFVNMVWMGVFAVVVMVVDGVCGCGVCGCVWSDFVRTWCVDVFGVVIVVDVVYVCVWSDSGCRWCLWMCLGW